MFVQSVHAFYRRFEPDTSRPFTQILLLAVVPSFAAVMSFQYLNKPAIFVLPSIFIPFYTALTTSIILYRLSPWHPLLLRETERAETYIRGPVLDVDIDTTFYRSRGF